MYDVYLGGMLLPVTPSKIQTKVNNQNKTINLINGEEINIIKTAGLTEISFECLLPMQEYSFAKYHADFVPANYFLDQLEKKKQSKRSFSFTVSRTTVLGDEVIFKTHMHVTLEEYTIVEDSDQGGDLTVSLKLKEYVNYGLRRVEIPKKEAKSAKSAVTVSRASSKEVPGTYTVQKGDTLWIIAKKLLGDGSKCWNLAKLNGISNPNLIRVGQVLKIKNVSSSSGLSSSNSNRSLGSDATKAGSTATNTGVSIGVGLLHSNNNSNSISTSIGGMSLALQDASPEAIARATSGITGSSGYSDKLLDYYAYKKKQGLQSILGGKK